MSKSSRFSIFRRSVCPNTLLYILAHKFFERHVTIRIIKKMTFVHFHQSLVAIGG
jgi:hypothetical protein